jgi:hypothetical protein
VLSDCSDDRASGTGAAFGSFVGRPPDPLFDDRFDN